MRTVSAAFKTYLASGNLTDAHLWLITLINGTIFSFTDHDTDIVFGGRTYMARSGFAASNVATSYALNVDNMEVQGMLSSPTITEADVLSGLWDGATVVLSMVNYADLTMGSMYLCRGVLGNIKTSLSYFTAELRGSMQKLQLNLLEYHSPACRAALGDARCKINLATYTFNGSVTRLETTRSWFDTALTQTNSVIQKAITGITKANPAIVTAVNHGFTTGQHVEISAVGGMTAINGRTGTVTFIGANSFSINIDTTLFSTYTSGGLATLAPASEYFQGGLVTWLTGLNAGLQHEVKLYTPGYVCLFQPAPYAIVIGDTYTISAGCDKVHSTCKNRFNNVINMRAEPHDPGMDALMQFGGA